MRAVTAGGGANLRVFTPEEIDYLQNQRLGRMATVGPDDQPHVIPVTFHLNLDEDSIDIAGIAFAEGKKWRDAQRNPKVTLLVDDRTAEGARAVEVRGAVELHETGGKAINPRFPNFVEQFFRLRPKRIVSWGLEEGAGFRPNSRTVA
ncbi:MAG: pyridoxamine 5'-phosphate oxidase family protein [Actinomycetota bacterium]|nr:pyridoxamine 5'-phosphate oxidase family protein [Actinomycetota bacterium]